mmetsp:Transcript_15234/g.39160  ORF Transcript_15234/g.39160 Transcript_15234/m.39160 type:complete len:548 (-) Transcript_15234:167-1810(-)|eukprot:CAMPEP_0182915750 /NCGR_PEP_ID=MMETSP0105_2-20130417/520_1 /TAXON_ID=81532 ORGANISM="Acanthoeca-like sp., Strain 10tr" /NCGR_SAMPLE_ID=MMETSP0105_2 /ASSEMBLY_ACC=CAM_ASM_000205 /LENGTH=547 /DNA_ID=CAMNT_0025052637 /DNA_START=173 /DNA_END=1816 /DNA_ORIENTATION=+
MLLLLVATGLASTGPLSSALQDEPVSLNWEPRTGPCGCPSECEIACEGKGLVCCSARERGATAAGDIPAVAVAASGGRACNCSGAAVCPHCVPSHSEVTDRSLSFDVTLGYIFRACPSVVPIDFFTGGNVHDRLPHTKAIMGRRDNYSVYDVCSKACSDFVAGPYWNGTRCDAWTVEAGEAREHSLLVSFNCTLYQFTDLNSGPAVAIDVPCPGCAAGVVHIVWPPVPLYAIVFGGILLAHLLHVIVVGVKYRHSSELREYIMMTIETFLPLFFAVVEMSESACSNTEDFAPTLIVWMALACVPHIVHSKLHLRMSVAADALFEALEHAGAGHHARSAEPDKTVGMAAGGLGPASLSLNPIGSEYEDADDSEDDALLVPSPVELKVPFELDRLERVRAAAEAKVESFEPLYQYSNAMTASILLHLYRIVRDQPARQSATLLFLFLGLEHAIPVVVWVLVSAAREKDRRKVARGLLRFGKGCVSWARRETCREVLWGLVSNRGIWILVSVGYTTAMLKIVLEDYATTSGAHVTCPTLLNGWFRVNHHL